MFSWTKRLVRQVVQRILDTVLWPRPVTPHWVDHQQNLCQTWEWTFSAPWDNMVMKCPIKIMVNSVGEGEGGMFRENSIETCILSRVKQITSPGWIHETSAQAWCTGKTQRDWVQREVGRGIGMGNTCKSMADSCQCMTKPTTIL